MVNLVLFKKQGVFVLLTESINVSKWTNHPVHIQDEDGKLSPTALIPFCEFGGNMSVMGVKIEEIEIPVCSSFRPKILRDQLCYTVDLSAFKDKIDLKGRQRKDGSAGTAAVNLNQARQISDALVTTSGFNSLYSSCIEILVGNRFEESKYLKHTELFANNWT